LRVPESLPRIYFGGRHPIARGVNPLIVFKKLQGEIWEFRTKFKKNQYRLFAFWDKEDVENTLVISTHGIVKKSQKVPQKEIERAERIRQQYFDDK
jgi:phage-related protein